jgi:hypothetical protein
MVLENKQSIDNAVIDRIRRVKCDETKPSCRRCLRFNGECDGYEVDLTRTPSKVIMPKTLAPLAPKLVPSTPTESPTSAFGDELWSTSSVGDLEYRYFRFFHEKTISRLSGYLGESMWNRLVLQACETEPSIRHAVIAIGALDMAFESGEIRHNGKRPMFPQTGENRGNAGSHHQFALEQYAKAIKQMRDTLSEPRRDMKNTLIACLLFVCFEKFHANNHLSLDEAQTGLKMVNGWLPQFVKQGALHGSHVPGPKSPASYVIEDELIHAFARLDLVLFPNEEPLKNCSKSRPSILEVCRLMPETFLSVEEARMYWELMWKQTLQYITNGTGWSSILGLEDSERIRSGEFWDSSFHDIRPRCDEKKEDYLYGIAKWSRAFEHLFIDSQRNLKDFAPATSLSLQHKAYQLAIAGGFRGEMYYDDHLKTFKDILSLSERLMLYVKDRESADRAIISLERLITGSIYMVARLCRDCHTRRKAIAMLEATPRREGTWDSVLMARIASISVGIEEDHWAGGHFVPERARIKAVRAKFNMKERTGILRFVKAKPEPGRESLIEEVAFSW